PVAVTTPRARKTTTPRDSRHESVTYRADVGVDRALAILAHAHHAVRCARAILALHPDFSGIETSPLCRLLVECAVTAAWLLITPGSGVAMVRDGAKQRVKALSELALTGRDVSELLAQADNVIKQLSASEGPRAFVFEQRCLALKDGRNWYITYRALSEQSHSGITISDFYSSVDPSSPIGVAFNPSASNETHGANLGLAACALVLAIDSEEKARAKPRRSAELKRIVRTLGLDGS
ncbi:DUF5677 domain-containing protein, partial [Microbacterium sp. Leaf351]